MSPCPTRGLDGRVAGARLPDLLLGKDFRPRAGDGSGTVAPDDGGNGADGGGNTDGGSRAASAAGFAVRGTLTVPVVTLAQLADRPGEPGGIGPIDPWLARTLPKRLSPTTIGDIVKSALVLTQFEHKIIN